MLMNNKLDMWVVQKGKFFPANAFVAVQEKLSKLPDSKINALFALPLKSPTLILVLSILLGGIGVDRFVLGDIVKGIAKPAYFILASIAVSMLFPGVDWLGIAIIYSWVGWWIFDAATSVKRAREYNLKILMKAIGNIK